MIQDVSMLYVNINPPFWGFLTLLSTINPGKGLFCGVTSNQQGIYIPVSTNLAIDYSKKQIITTKLLLKKHSDQGLPCLLF